MGSWAHHGRMGVHESSESSLWRKQMIPGLSLRAVLGFLKCLSVPELRWATLLIGEGWGETSSVPFSEAHENKVRCYAESSARDCLLHSTLDKLLNLHKCQFSSVAQSCLTLCDPMNHSMPGLHVHHQLLEFTQTHRVGDAIQPSQPLLSSSPPAPNPS